MTVMNPSSLALLRRTAVARRAAIARQATASRRSAQTRRTRPPLMCVAIGVMAFALAACGGGTDGAGSSGELAGTFRLVSGTTASGEIPIIDGHDITLQIDGDQWNGTAACNSYTGTVTATDSRLTVGDVIRTEMACLEDGVMESENAYLDAFQRVSGYQSTDGTLVLSDGDVELTYERVEPDAA